jgi:tetratricopeptide (TPR) repeat protein
MDVKFPGRLACLGAAVLALASACQSTSADDGSSIAFVVASDDAGDADLPPVAEPSDLVIQVTDDEPSAAKTVVATPAPSAAAHGDLTVVANVNRPAPIAAVIADPAVVQAGSVEAVEGSRSGRGWDAMLSSGPRRPSALAGIQSQQRGSRPATAPSHAQRPAATARAERTNPADEPPAVYEAVPAVVRNLPTTPLIKSPVEHAKGLLVEAYQLSLSASNETEYSQIVQWCATASRAGLDAESTKFGSQLSAWALNRRGQARADQGQHDLALADFRAALEFDANNWRALHNRAVTYAQHGQFAEAFDDFCRVIQINPKYAKAYSNRASLYVQAGDFEKALADYDAALVIDAKLLAALVGRGRVCHIHGKLDEALASFNAAVESAPQDADVFCSRADLLADLGRYDDALDDYATAIDLNPHFEHAFRNGAWLLATCPDDAVRDADGAIAGAQAALECGYGERHAALDTLAAAFANASRWEEAVGTIRQAIEIAPEESRPAYQARLQLYEANKPFRTRPVGAATIAVAAEMDSGAAEATDGDQSAVYIEE